MDIYAAVTDRIIAQLEEGCCPWNKPWIASNQAVSRTTGKPYSQLLDEMVSLALKRSRSAAELNYSIDTGILKNFTGGGSKGSKGGKLGPR